MMRGPRRIACLTAETVDLLYRLGVQDRIVGVSGYSHFPPEARRKPFVSAFTTIYHDVIDSLRPDLILGFSDLQADAVRELSRRGYPVLFTNQRTLAEMFDTLVMIGRIVDKGPEAEELVAALEAELAVARAHARSWPRRPKVYFEEWDDPLITGLAWIHELIDACGGEDVFQDLSCHVTAPDRVVRPEAVVERAPEIIIASWCGKKVRFEAIRARPGWDAIPAVRDGEMHEIKSRYCLQPGPSLIAEGLPRIGAVIEAWQAKRSTGAVS
jgi:iron complex transport system substrate-binding protein